MNIVIKERSEDISYKVISDTVQKAYAVWDEKGYDYAARHYTAEDIERVTATGTCLVALADGKLVGTLVYYLNRDYKELGTTNSVHSHVLAVVPEYMGHGIAAMLFNRMLDDATKASCGEYVADTCADNKRLLMMYTRLGCRIVSYTSFANTSYYSAIFMKPLNKSYSNGYFIYHRIKGWLKTHLLYNADGSYRPAAKLLRKIKGL